jgi:penicillin-binding protein 2
MTELRNIERELHRFRLRLLIASLSIIVLFVALLGRLVWLQVIKHEQLATQAEENRVSIVPIVPNRGLILDRNGVVLATNYSAYTLELTPSKLDDVEATIDELSKLIEITSRDKRRFKKLTEESKNFESLPIRTRLSDEEVARFAAQRWRFTGVDIKARPFRQYPLGETASHVLGYMGRISERDETQIEDWTDERQANYRGTESIGKLGLEQSYEQELHGLTGFEEVEVSAGGRAMRKLAAHKSTPGNTLILSIDIKLQRMVEELFGDRRGALVAIDPRNGEVLAFVSKPTYDPNLFVDGIDTESWKDLNESIDKPLLNRPLNGTYPPGSTYKPFMAMAALSTGTRSPSTIITDNASWQFGNHTFRSHGDIALGSVDMYKSIVKSSNVYYYSLANELGVDTIYEQMQPFGFGQTTGIDLRNESTGVLPSTAWKARNYKKPEQKRWYAGETISLGIGQGYNAFTVLQLASATATLSHGGERFKPRLVKEVENVVTRDRKPLSQDKLTAVKIAPEHLEVIKRALVGVTQEGTSAGVFKNAEYLSGGKTGTAQAVTIRQNERYDARKIAEHQRDHSLYTAFAPADEPRVALAIVVENAGFGAVAAAPIARKVFDYMLLGKLPSTDEVATINGGTKPERSAAVAAVMGAQTSQATQTTAASAIAKPAAGKSITNKVAQTTQSQGTEGGISLLTSKAP